MSKRKPTVAAGAVIEREYLKDKLTRMQHLSPATNQEFPEWAEGYSDAVEELRIWLKTQPGRTKRPGGIGRK